MKVDLAPETADMVARAAEATQFLRHFAHPTRLMVACALIDGERTVRDLEDTLRIRQPGLSQQLAELREAGLIVGRKAGKNMVYRLADDRVAGFIAVMYRLFCDPRGGDENRHDQGS